MPLRSISAVALWTVCVTICGALPANAQTTPPPRAAQRTPAAADAPAPAAKPPTSKARSQAPRQQDQPAAGNVPAPAPAGGQRPAIIARNLAPINPFNLTESQKNLLEQILLKWEQHSDKVTRFTCTFTRWDYDPAFGPRKLDFCKSESEGSIKYKSPDCGEYHMEKCLEWDPGKEKYLPKTDGLDHWVCDGKAIYEFNHPKKQLIKRKLPPDMQGMAIADGPLPFVFGAKADQLKRRYWLKDVTPDDQVGKQIWLKAIPKFQQDLINFQSATVILKESDFLPFALEIVLPDGKNKTAYAFKNTEVNSLLQRALEFLAPTKPIGWTLVEEDIPSDAPQAPPAQDDKSQAKRPAGATKRK